MFKTNALHFLFIVLLISSASNANADTKIETPDITQAQLLSLKDAPQSPPFIVLDVRTEEEFIDGHIDQALNISHNELEQRLADLTAEIDKDQLIIVHCRSGKRAAKAEQILRNNDFTQVRHLSGDMLKWQENQLPLTQGKK